jgi:hypothetical protein
MKPKQKKVKKPRTNGKKKEATEAEKVIRIPSFVTEVTAKLNFMFESELSNFPPELRFLVGGRIMNRMFQMFYNPALQFAEERLNSEQEKRK